MAEIVGCLGIPHGPQLLMPTEKWADLPTRVKDPGPEKPELARELTPEAKNAKQKRCQDSTAVLQRKLDEMKPDVVVLVGDDQRENVQDDNMPPFIVCIGDPVVASLNFPFLGESPMAQKRTYKAHPALASGVIEGLLDHGFDPAWSKRSRLEFGLGHAFGRPLQALMPKDNYPVLPIMVNTFYSPTASPKRCFEFGTSLGNILRSFQGGERIVVVASGGLSHVRIDEQLDRDFIKALERFDAEYLTSLPASLLVEGTSELRTWIIVAAAAGKGGTLVDYVPCYRTPRGIGCAMAFAYWN